jgi:ADP-ribose pyrophosphatase YjhB (NUDIX family)
MNEQPIRMFNIRVYGIAINANSELLVTDEFRLGMRMTKFPGGGLEFGEGTIDCLKRECREEMNQEINIIRHFYTTDYFQPTYLLKAPQQLISVYYLMELTNPDLLKTSNKKFDFTDIDGNQSFRWVKIEDMDEDEMTFPVDRKVAGMVKGL